MPQEVISIGPPTLLKAGVAYSLPAVAVDLFTDTLPTITQSNTVAFTASSPVTLTGGSASVGAAFIKVSADTTVILKRA